jgi:hypothetical protein
MDLRNSDIVGEYNDCENFAEVARKFGLSISRIRDIVYKAIRLERIKRIMHPERFAVMFSWFYISAEPMNEDVLDVKTFEAVDEWLPLGSGDIVQGGSGDPTISILRRPSKEMDFINSACEVDNTNNYGFKLGWPDGSFEYYRGLVIGPYRDMSKISDSDFAYNRYTLGLNQAPIIAKEKTK